MKAYIYITATIVILIQVMVVCIDFTKDQGQYLLYIIGGITIVNLFLIHFTRFLRNYDFYRKTVTVLNKTFDLLCIRVAGMGLLTIAMGIAYHYLLKESPFGSIFIAAGAYYISFFQVRITTPTSSSKPTKPQ
jgi:hypothetical protein